MHLETYRRFLRAQPYSFRKPRTDVCDYCAVLKQKIKQHKNSRIFDVKLRVHERQVAKYKEIKGELLKKHAGDQNVLILEFDFAQNLPFPRLNVTSQFYKRLFWMYILNIHNHCTGQSAMYYYTEKEGKKNANAICSMMYDYIGKNMSDEVQKIYLFSDSCGGQNKNYTVVSFLSWLSRELSVEVMHYFPVRGHSYNVCDRNFGCYSRCIKKFERIETVPEYVKIIKGARKRPYPFEMNHFTDFRQWGEGLKLLCNPVPKKKNARFTIQKYKILSYSPSATRASTLYHGAFQVFQIMRTNNKTLQLQSAEAPEVKAAKTEDVKSLIQFLSVKSRRWFQENMFI